VTQWTSAPPSSSAITSSPSPVPALTNGSPPRKMVPLSCTIIVSSDMAGAYAPPAVQLPEAFYRAWWCWWRGTCEENKACKLGDLLNSPGLIRSTHSCKLGFIYMLAMLGSTFCLFIVLSELTKYGLIFKRYGRILWNEELESFLWNHSGCSNCCWTVQIQTQIQISIQNVYSES